MKAILDRLEWIAMALRQTAEERQADRDAVAAGLEPTSTEAVAFQCMEEIKAIAETLPDKPSEAAISNFEVGKLNVGLGDTVVIKFPELLSRDQSQAVIEHMRGAIGDVPVVVLSGGTDLIVLTGAEIEARLAEQRQPPERIIDLSGK